MEIKATCQMCGKPYIKKNGKSMFCSDACKKARVKQKYEAEKEKRLAYQKKWREEHMKEAKERFKERHPDYYRERARKMRNSQEYTRTCVVCGKEFTTWLPQKKTCSEECKATWGKERDKGRKRDGKKDEERERERQHERWIKRRYGSEEAYQKYLTEREQEKRERERQKLIEEEEKELRRNKRKAEAEKRMAQREAQKEKNHRFGTCVVCGKGFETYNPKQKTCCRECGRKYFYARKHNRIPENQIVDNDITLEALYRRDSGVCYLCGTICDWNDRDGLITFNNYPTVDHVTPISLGGLHAWNNVKLACFRCNTLKGNKIIIGNTEHKGA